MDQAILAAVQWALFGAFVAVALTLLVPRADQYRQSYLKHGTDEDQRQAVWRERDTKGAAFIVLVLLGLVGGLGIVDMARASPAPSPLKWVGMCVMLFLPVFTQFGFLALLVRWVQPVPPLRELRLRRAPTKRRPSSPMGEPALTVVRFLNRRAADVWVWDLTYNGTVSGDGMLVPPGEERTAYLGNTRVGRHFLIRSVPDDKDNLEPDLYLVTAAATPGRATITE